MKGLRCVEKQRLAQMSVLWLQRSLRDTLKFNFLLISTNFSCFNASPTIMFFWFEECTYKVNRQKCLFFFLKNYVFACMYIMCIYWIYIIYIKLVDFNLPEHRQPELKMQCYLSPSSFFKATEASVSLAYPMLFVQKHQTSEDWSNAFLNGMRLRPIVAGCKWKRPLRSLLFPLQVQICYLQIHSFQPLLWDTWLSFRQSCTIFFSGLN